MNPENCAIIILAAGKSSRLGTPKQLVDFKGKPLLQHAIDVAIATGIKPLLVVLGADFQKIKNEIIFENMAIVENSDWEKGMSTSIICGLNALISQHPFVKIVIFMVCDQPFLNSEVLLELVRTQSETGLPIVASDYGEAKGTPVLFTIDMFDALLALSGDAGAGKLIRQHSEKTAFVPFQEGIIDIDRGEDLKFLK